MTWRGREVKIEDGVILASKVDDPNNWDFGADEGAWAMIPGSIGVPEKVKNLSVIDDDHLLVVCENGNVWLLIGDVGDKNSRLTKLEI